MVFYSLLTPLIVQRWQPPARGEAGRHLGTPGETLGRPFSAVVHVTRVSQLLSLRTPNNTYIIVLFTSETIQWAERSVH